LGKAQNKNTGHWLPDDPVTDRDLEILEPLIVRAKELGRTPTRNDMQGARLGRIKSRFRTWDIAILAAGLPGLKTPEQQEAREAAKKLEEGT